MPPDPAACSVDGLSRIARSPASCPFSWSLGAARGMATNDQDDALLRADPHHPSLHFKKIGGSKSLWSVRMRDNDRALGVEKPEGIVRFWIGDRGSDHREK